MIPGQWPSNLVPRCEHLDDRGRECSRGTDLYVEAYHPRIQWGMWQPFAVCRSHYRRLLRALRSEGFLVREPCRASAPLNR